MKEYSKTKKYDRKWIEENQMGPNPILLMEELCENLDLKPGMKVLDMGCGKGLTSVFLAKEYGVTVFANDLWISATENLCRFEEAGVSDRVFPIKAEAHALPYANGFFDAAVSATSYHYFGTDEAYFPCTYSKLVKPGGQFGIVVPGYVKEFEKGYPDTLEEFFVKQRAEHGNGWGEDMFTFHSNAWWRNHWEKHGIVNITACYDIEDAHGIWLYEDGWIEYVDADKNKDIAFIIMAAIKK
ncbi:MAG: methyltransferase domain-containing protein [Firmicutes bacterium]|nr:methyltransferase domain-containing protein [Bacillota bacterium]